MGQTNEDRREEEAVTHRAIEHICMTVSIRWLFRSENVTFGRKDTLCGGKIQRLGIRLTLCSKTEG
jgi:hypothetical protein